MIIWEYRKGFIMKKKIPEKELLQLQSEIIQEIDHWKHMNDNGCNDPFWTDGCNMNLTRNHIIYYRRNIERLCSEMECNLPPEYYLPIPPEVDNNYMANLDHTVRVKRLRATQGKLTSKKKAYDDSQLSFL